MGREEFLRGLAQSLSGHVSQNVIQENLNYYDEYIRQEVQKGRTEEEIIQEIGTPRLIAKTIIDASGGTDDGFEEAGNSSGSFYGGSYNQDIYEDQENSKGRGSFRMYDFSSGWKKYAVIGGILLVIFVIFSIVGSILSLLMPFLVPVCIVWLVWRMFRGQGR